jgi:hypothetical protein
VRPVWVTGTPSSKAAIRSTGQEARFRECQALITGDHFANQFVRTDMDSRLLRAKRKVVRLLTDVPNLNLDRQKGVLTRNLGAELEGTRQCVMCVTCRGYCPRPVVRTGDVRKRTISKIKSSRNISCVSWLKIADVAGTISVSISSVSTSDIRPLCWGRRWFPKRRYFLTTRHGW